MTTQDSGGLGLVFKALEQDALPADVNVHTRQSVYLAALQIADALLSSNVPAADQDKKQTSSPTIKPTPPKRSALDNSAKAGSTSKGLPASNAAMGILREMYMPGVSDEGARDAQCYEVRLSGSPWSHNSSYNLG